MDGGWFDWSSWIDCSVICGNGIMLCVRNCDNLVLMVGGRYCKGFFEDVKLCNVFNICYGEC